MGWKNPDLRDPLGSSIDPYFDAYEWALRKGRCFRIEQFLTLNSGNTRTFLSITPNNKTECHFRVKIESTGETEYKVFVEPTVILTGTNIPAVSKNPHIQFLGGYKAKFLFYSTPVWSASGTTIRQKHWSSGSKDTGSYEQELHTILSPTQTLLYYIKSHANTNYINFELHWHEDDEGYMES